MSKELLFLTDGKEELSSNGDWSCMETNGDWSCMETNGDWSCMEV
ncbi:hypothetical protein OF820_08860 [Oceanotoga sp. DSM 15011]|nr:hypothetical protein [Oceanotoga sp. DSM 15011]UYO99182.1 hypothetical protein OF820_08860 [Oceanotoga sp. DSM 15011]